YSAPKGVSIFTPPAKGFAGSAVWQLEQSAATVSALPCAIVSAEGSARASANASALHNTRHPRIDRIASPVVCCRPRQPGPADRIIGALCRFATALRGDRIGK